MIRIIIDDEPVLTDRLLRLLDVPERLDGIEHLLTRIILKERQIMADLTTLKAEVTRNTEVDQSAIALLTGLAAQIEALKTDPAALQALADELKGSSDALANAITANTPAAPTA
jgi:hypothetical protein